MKNIQKNCLHCSSNFEITPQDEKFYDKISPQFPLPAGEGKGEGGFKKYKIPPPTLCPDCRQQRRFSFRDERNLYHRTCDLSGKSYISYYSPENFLENSEGQEKLL